MIAPSILSADFSNLQRDIEMINKSVADWIHVDVMDGVFVPNISLGIPVVEAIQKHAKKPLDVHLMIVNPELYVDKFKTVGAANITVHYEACVHLHRTIELIKKLDCKAGVALNPHTPIHLLTDIIDDLDTVCLMSVNPGFGGQKFINNTYSKISALKELSLQKNNQQLIIQVDGGVNLSNANLLRQAGANMLIAGNAIFTSKDPKEAIMQLKECSK